MPISLDYDKLSDDQRTDTELQSNFTSGIPKSSLKLLKFTLPGSTTENICDTSTNRLRPFITRPFRLKLIGQTHNLAHPSRRATVKLMTDRFVWPGIRSDFTSFVKNCLKCQRAKVSKNTSTPLARYLLYNQRSVLQISTLISLGRFRFAQISDIALR